MAITLNRVLKFKFEFPIINRIYIKHKDKKITIVDFVKFSEYYSCRTTRQEVRLSDLLIC